MMATLLTPRRPCTILPQPGWTAALLLYQAGDGYPEAHPRTLAGRALYAELPAELERPVAHGLPAYPDPGTLRVEPATVVRDLDVGEQAVEPQFNPDAFGLCVAADVRERLLDEARELLARFVREPGREIVVYYQFEFV